jgi:hypothetical protein
VTMSDRMTWWDLPPNSKGTERGLEGRIDMSLSSLDNAVVAAAPPPIPRRLYGVWCAGGGADGLGSWLEHVDFSEAQGPAAFHSAADAAVAMAYEERESRRCNLDLLPVVVLIGVSPAVVRAIVRELDGLLAEADAPERIRDRLGALVAAMLGPDG